MKNKLLSKFQRVDYYVQLLTEKTVICVMLYVLYDSQFRKSQKRIRNLNVTGNSKNRKTSENW